MSSVAVVGLLTALGAGIAGYWPYAAVLGWAAACVVYVSWVWLAVGRMDAEQTSMQATREHPARSTADLLLLFASVASLFALLFVLAQAQATHGAGKALLAILAIASVVLSWLLVHTLFTLRYAELYYTGEDGGVDFNQDAPPSYADFAYLSFTIGMTFQVSDTDIDSTEVRKTALRHALLSYLFGSVILASTVNLIATIIG
jgi:uncharacterized membrane protein